MDNRRWKYNMTELNIYKYKKNHRKSNLQKITNSTWKMSNIIISVYCMFPNRLFKSFDNLWFLLTSVIFRHVQLIITNTMRSLGFFLEIQKHILVLKVRRKTFRQTTNK